MVEDDDEYLSTEKTYTSHVRSYIQDYMRIHNVTHLDLSKKVYKCVTSNGRWYGKPSEYTINSSKDWEFQMKLVYERDQCDMEEYYLQILLSQNWYHFLSRKVIIVIKEFYITINHLADNNGVPTIRCSY